MNEGASFGWIGCEWKSYFWMD